MRVTHPTDRPNFTRVDTSNGTVWFSYETPIAFAKSGVITVRVNDWSVTTGKHLNYIDNGDKNSRVSGNLFNELYAKSGLA